MADMSAVFTMAWSSALVTVVEVRIWDKPMSTMTKVIMDMQMT